MEQYCRFPILVAVLSTESTHGQENFWRTVADSECWHMNHWHMRIESIEKSINKPRQ
jgi:hypothetical protein